MKKSTLVYFIVSVILFFVFAFVIASINVKNPESLWNWKFALLFGAIILNTSIAFTIATHGPIFEHNK